MPEKIEGLMTDTMIREVVPFTTKEAWLAARNGDITSTEVSALFGCCPYMTLYELWHRKKTGTVVEIEENEDMEWGKALEGTIAAKVAEKQGWKIRPMTEYIRIPELRAGSSFDFCVGDMERNLEIKNVNAFIFKDDWIVNDDKTVEAPPHIEFQAQHQMMVSGMPLTTIAVLIGGSRPRLLHREPDERVIAVMKQKIAEFWKSIDDGVEPAPDFEKDAEFIISMNGRPTEGKFLNAHDDVALMDMAAEFDRLGYEGRRIDKEREAMKAKLLMRIGDTEKVVGEGFSISAGMVAGGHVEYDRKPYRNFRISFKKNV